MSAEKRRIVYFGSDVFLPSFRYLADRCEILALYTYHYREDCFTEYGIVREARRRGIPVVYGRISEERVRRYFEEEGCDFLFAAEYGYLIPVPAGLRQFRGVNVHNALLPEGRGYYPVEVTMARRVAETGVTMHKIISELDAGDILFHERFAIRPEMDSVDVYLESRRHALAMTRRLLDDFEGAWRNAQPQPSSEGGFCTRPDAARLTLARTMTTAEATGVYRVYNQMTRVVLAGETRLVTSLEPGHAVLDEPEVEIAENRWLYPTADGHLRLSVQSLEEKR